MNNTNKTSHTKIDFFNLESSLDADNSSSVNSSRRDFLSKAAIAGTITIAPGVLLHSTAHAATSGNTSTKANDEEVSSKNRWGMLIDTAKCASGCTDCVDACNEENGLVGHGRPATDTQYIRKVTLKEKSTGHELSLPLITSRQKISWRGYR